MMDGGRVSDFSIERILSPQVGPRPQVADLPQTVSGGLTLDFGYAGPAAPGPAAAACCQRYRGMGFVEACYPCGTCFHRPDLHLCPGVCVHAADAQLCAGFHVLPHPAAPPQAPLRQKTRMRTVFTDAQSRQLEALFELSDYPHVEARAELARRTGLSEETVRVWFKNRRARRKRQCSGAGVQSPPSPPEKPPFL
ncbi:dharma [Betta splendens]|uniref:Dharma n=1 Tax=Betta splendens TaxID=158456 RepID=A0A6P7P5P5_BETSP|nr:dharma [Betta splendens]